MAECIEGDRYFIIGGSGEGVAKIALRRIDGEYTIRQLLMNLK
jgi:hypothetical protein